MFQGLLMRAERSIDSVVAKYMGRALVAVPLLVGAGFATAALTVKLVELYGSVTGYALMAALFGVIGLVTMAITGIEQRPAVEAAPAETPAAAAAADAAAGDAINAADLLTPELRAVLASAAPMALPSLVRGVGKNLPLILILALIGFIISRFAGSSETFAADAGTDGAGPDPDPGTRTDPAIHPAAMTATSAAAAAA